MWDLLVDPALFSLCILVVLALAAWSEGDEDE